MTQANNKPIEIPPWKEPPPNPGRWGRFGAVIGFFVAGFATTIIHSLICADKLEKDPSLANVGSIIAMFTAPIGAVIGYIVGLILEEKYR